MFCCKSCAATCNNRKYPKRVKQKKLCLGCRRQIEPTRTWCDTCLPAKQSKFMKERHRANKEIATRLNLSYREDEIPIKESLESKYGKRFHKEKIGRRYIDFANKKLLIEHTVDGTHGIQDVISRFGDVAKSEDTRRRVAYVNTDLLGAVRRKRLLLLRVKIRDFRELT